MRFARNGLLVTVLSILMATGVPAVAGQLVQPLEPRALEARAQQLPAVSAAVMHARTLLDGGNARAARAAFLTLAEANDADAQDALAAMWLEGIGGPADRETAMYWFCRLAHQPRGGRTVMRALWFLAEYFRTGGGLPGQRYTDGTRDLQNPLKAYFWYQVMVRQAELYDTTYDEARKLARLGRASVARELYDGEKQQVLRRAQRWSPSDPVTSACLNLPQS